MKRLVGLAAMLAVTVGLFGGGSSALAARSLTPPTADFGNQQLATTSAPKAFTLLATCQAVNPIAPSLCLVPEVVPTAATVTDAFTIVQNACPQPLLVAQTLAPVTCTVTVAFKPTAIGPFVGSLKIGGLTSALSGTGTPAPVVTPPATTPTTPPTTTTPAPKKKKCGKRKGKKKGQKARSSASASKKKGCKRR